jgi:hypothetical protein
MKIRLLVFTVEKSENLKKLNSNLMERVILKYFANSLYQRFIL